MRLRFSVLLILVLATLNLRAAEGPSAEDLLPGSTVLAISIPDLTATRAAAAKTRVAEILNQPEIQAFMRPPLDTLDKAYDTLRAKRPELPALADLEGGLFSGEIAAGLFIDLKTEGPTPGGLVIVARPKDPEALKRALPAALRESAFAGKPAVFELERGLPAAFTWSNGYFVFCAPATALDGVLAKLKDPALLEKDRLSATPAFKGVKTRLAGSAGFLYCAPSAIRANALQVLNLQIEALKQMQGAERHLTEMNRIQAMLDKGLDLLGVAKTNAVAVGLNFKDGEPCLEACAEFEGAPTGLMALGFSTQGVPADALKIAAKDAPFVSAGHVYLSRIIPLVREIAAMLEPRAQAQIDQGLAMVNKFLGFDLQKDFLENLEGDFVSSQTVLQTGSPLSFMPGMTVSMGLKDPAQVQGCLDKLAGLGEATKGVLQLKRLEHKGNPIYYLSTRFVGGPVAMSISGKRLILGTTLNALRRGIEQLEAADDIRANPDFQATLARLTGQPFDAAKLPPSFSYGVDHGSGAGMLMLASGGGLLKFGALAGLTTISKAGGQNIGRNEAAAQAVCMVFAEAQEIYLRTDYNGDDVKEYAQSIAGGGGKYGLYTDGANGATEGNLSLVDKGVAAASVTDNGEKAKPSHGYLFKILTGQGEAAPGGAKSYIVNGRLVNGYALLAFPAEYGKSGKNCFVINNTGQVYAKDLGEKTAELAAKMDAYNPNRTWVVGDEAPVEASDPKADLMALVTPVISQVDMGLWPDEGFFQKYRQPTGAATICGENFWYSRTELPPPMPSTNLGSGPMLAMGTATVAIVAAVAIPNLLRSRMAANESAAIAACKTFAEAEEIYLRTDYNRDGVKEYAQHIAGGKGEYGLYTDGAADATMGNLCLVDAAFAHAEGAPGVAQPRSGYVFKILTKQGANAQGGKKSYIVNGRLVNGYALLAIPSSYDSTGRNTFIINNIGQVYQKDMGKEATEKAYEQMDEFNPDRTWIVAE